MEKARQNIVYNYKHCKRTRLVLGMFKSIRMTGPSSK